MKSLRPAKAGLSTLYVVGLFLPCNVYSQSINPPPQQTGIGFESFVTSREMWLSIFILVFGLATIGIQYLLLRQVVGQHISEIYKLFTVTLIIIGTLLLISSGFSSQQISPALGLFGTIAGYILATTTADGKQKRQSRQDEPQP